MALAPDFHVFHDNLKFCALGQILKKSCLSSQDANIYTNYLRYTKKEINFMHGREKDTKDSLFFNEVRFCNDMSNLLILYK